MNITPYDSAAAIEYAHAWAMARNPKYADFEHMGGDCSNFISQALLAGGAVMNDARDTGWYYRSLKDRAPAWTGVPFLFNFLTKNQGRGPFGHVIALEEVQPGDIIQLRFADKNDFSHSLMVTDAGDPPPPHNNLSAAHSYDSHDRPLCTYSYVEARAIRIDGIRA
jgi:hypothetical protein